MANVKCPKCGELNKSLNLEENKGMVRVFEMR